MNVLAVCGSARKEGNTATLMREALAGAGVPEAEIVFVSELDMSGCRGCRKCRKEGLKGCVLKDEMQGLYDRMKAADALVIGSPVYYGEVTGQTKLFMDRWYALRDGERKLRLRDGMKVAFLLVQGADGAERYAHTAGRLDKVMKSYGMEAEVVVFPSLEEKGSAKGSADSLARARKAGERLTGS